MSIAHRVRALGGARWKAKLAAAVALVATMICLSPSAVAVADSVVFDWLSGELLKMPRSVAPGETREEYDGRVRDVSRALVDEARGFADGKGWSMTELAAAAGMIWGSETLFDRRIQSGEGHPKWHQDHGRARCGMQLHSSGIVPPDVWERLVGTDKDTLHLCAQYGLRVVIAQAKQCGVYFGQRADKGRVAKMVASYGSGGNCTPTDAAWQRADRWVKIMATRPDRTKAPHPGYRRAAPAEIPDVIHVSAAGVRSEIGKEPEVVPGYMRTERSPDGRLFALLVEKHAQGKIGVSVLVGE